MTNSARVIQWGLVALLIWIAGASGAATSSAQTAPPYWPDGEWRTSTPEEQGLDSMVLAGMLEGVRAANIDSVLVIRHGYAVLDAYTHPFHADALRSLHSAAKGFTAALVGIAIGQGHITSVDQPVLELFARWTAANRDARKEALTLEHLLTMTAGFDCIGGVHITQLPGDWVQGVLDRPMIAAPGQTFAYCDANAFLLAAAVQEASGTSALEFAGRYLFEPLGIDRFEWNTSREGRITGWGGLYLRPRDMAKLGYLYLHGGLWDGQQLIPADYVAASTAWQVAREAGTGYGYQWNVSDQGYFWVDGHGGQFIIIMPEHDLVAVFTSTQGASDGPSPRRLFEQYILPALRSGSPLPANPDGAAALRAQVAALAHPQPAAVAPLPAIASAISGQTYVIEDPGTLGSDSFTLSFADGADEARLAVETNGTLVDMPIGLDGVYRVVPSTEESIGARGFWSGNRFILQIHEVNTPWLMTMQCFFAGDRATVVWSEAVYSMRGRFTATRAPAQSHGGQAR